MNITCEIIKDLLPLYHDDVCSGDTRRLVEEHLSLCEACRAELNVMDETLSESDRKQNLRDAEAVKGLSRRWKKGMVKSLLKGALFTLLAILGLALVLYLFVGIRVA